MSPFVQFIWVPNFRSGRQRSSSQPSLCKDGELPPRRLKVTSPVCMSLPSLNSAKNVNWCDRHCLLYERSSWNRSRDVRSWRKESGTCSTFRREGTKGVSERDGEFNNRGCLDDVIRLSYVRLVLSIKRCHRWLNIQRRYGINKNKSPSKYVCCSS